MVIRFALITALLAVRAYSESTELFFPALACQIEDKNAKCQDQSRGWQRFLLPENVSLEVAEEVRYQHCWFTPGTKAPGLTTPIRDFTCVPQTSVLKSTGSRRSASVSASTPPPTAITDLFIGNR